MVKRILVDVEVDGSLEQLSEGPCGAGGARTRDGRPVHDVRRVIGLVEALDARGSGLAELVPARGLGLLAERAACMGLPALARTSAGGALRLVSAADGDRAVPGRWSRLPCLDSSHTTAQAWRPITRGDKRLTARPLSPERGRVTSRDLCPATTRRRLRRHRSRGSRTRSQSR